MKTPFQTITEAANSLEVIADNMLFAEHEYDKELSAIEGQMLLQLHASIQYAHHSAKALALAVKACKEAKENA